MLKLKLRYFGYLMWRDDSFIGKDLDARKDWRWEEKGTTEDEMVGWHHWLDAHEFEQAQGAGDGQGSLACCGPWGRKESDTTERLNWTEQWQKEISTVGYIKLKVHYLKLSEQWDFQGASYRERKEIQTQRPGLWGGRIRRPWVEVRGQQEEI